MLLAVSTHTFTHVFIDLSVLLLWVVARCAEVTGAPTDDLMLNIVQVRTCEFGAYYADRDTDHLWYLTEEGFLLNGVSRLCLDVDGTPGVKAGSSMRLQKCAVDPSNINHAAQRWVITPRGRARGPQ